MPRIRALLARLGSSSGLPALATTAGALVLAMLAAAVGLDVVAGVLVVVSVLGELLLARRAPGVALLLDQAAFGLPMRFVLRVVVILLAVGLVADGLAFGTFVVLSVLYLVALCGRALHHEYRRIGPLRPMRTRHVTGNPTIAVAPSPRSVEVVATQLGVLVPALAGAPWWVVLSLGVASVLWLAAVTVPDVRRSWSMRQAKRATGYTPQLRQVQDFLDDYRPEVLLHLSGPLGSAYQVDTWLESLEALDRRVLLVLRDRALMDTMRATSLPTLELSNAGEILMLDFRSVKVALYPSNTGNNIHLLRLPHIMSAFVGHGDSDKSASANPFSRVYDELWVAGEAGADRYRRSGLGVHEDQFRFVGRPQVHGISPTPRLGDEDVPTVLYAPTWEGVNTGQEYSSVSAVGAQVVEAVLAADPPVRLVYKPHPFTGQRDAKYRAVDARIARLVSAAAKRTGIDHRVVRGGPIEPWFNTCSALFTDISSVVSDFLASEKPIAVFNHTALDDDAFRATFPSAGAATVVGRDGRGIAEHVDVVTGRTPDALAVRRRELATYLLGPPQRRTLEAFADSVEAFIARAEVERAQYAGLSTAHAPSEDLDAG